MTDREIQRQNKRTAVTGFSCTAGAELTPLQNPAGRPTPACDPVSPTPAPFTTVTPEACPAPLPAALNLPPGLLVVNDTTTAYCPSTGGYSVTGTTASTITAGTQQQLVIFTLISNITDNQLNYLYDIVPSSSAAIITAALSGATSSVIDLTHLNYNQSEELIGYIQDAKFTVNTLTVEQARNLLLCQVENNLQAAVCPTSAYFGPSASIPPGTPYTPSATSSTGSVLVTFALTPTSGNQEAFTLINIPSLTAAAAQANSIALAQAESSLRCVYANAATAAACCVSEAPYNNLGFTYCVPATGPSIPGSPTAIGYFSVDANTVFSSVSLAEANNVARELSRNSLICYFPSDGVTATCVDLGLTAPFAAASTTSVHLDQGSVILYDLDSSVTAATEQASLIAFASLNCFWSNSEQTAFCPPSGTFTAINNQTYNLDASSSASLHYSSTVPANSVISYTSQSDANAQALQLASANVSCSYCNDIVYPTCSGGVNATIGTSPNLICNVLAEVAQNTAISLGNILVSNSDGGLNCCYGSDSVTNTIKCSSGAYYSGSTSSNFTSADTFFLPANIITICQSTTAPAPPPLLFPYTNLYATDVAQVGCCSDIALCGPTGSVTAIPTLWAYTSNLFDVITEGATFYSDSSGVSAYAFPAGANYVVSRSSTLRTYRTVTGGTGYADNLLSCDSCGSLTDYTLRGSTAVNYSSTGAAMIDMFCNGPTAQSITLYTTTSNILSSPSYWYTDACGLSAFTPVSSTSATAQYFLGYVAGSTGYLLAFSSSGSNIASLVSSYSQSSCPLSRYAYTIYPYVLPCSTASGATTVYGSLPAPQLFTSYTGPTKFYTSQFNDASTFYSAAAFINYVAPDTSVYVRDLAAGGTAYEPYSCSPLNRVTVQWSNVSADEVCDHPSFYSPTGDGYFNSNIRTLWCTIANPFTDSATARFYTAPSADPVNSFYPGVSGPVYLAEFSPGATFNSTYRQYSWSNPISSLESYTGTFKASPFLQGSSAGTVGPTGIWLHSATGFFMSTSQVGGLPGTKETLAPDTECHQQDIYSDIKFAFSGATALNQTYKRLSQVPGISNDLYSSYLLFDGIGYKLSSYAYSLGYVDTNYIALNDMSKIGAGFTGAIIRTDNESDIGASPYPNYIASIDFTSGIVEIGGYYNNVNNEFTDTSVYVTGFKIEAAGWTGGSNPNFQCYGPNCNKLDVGHSLYSYKIGSPPSIGYVTSISGSTIYYSAAPGYDNFLASYAGTGGLDGSGHVYIQGRQFARLWTDNDKQNPIFKDLDSNTYNYVWKDNGQSLSVAPIEYTTAKNLIVGNTAGSTASFIVAGVNYNNLTIRVPRPYNYNDPITWDPDLNSYYYTTWSYSCTGAVSSYINPVFHTEIGYFSSCCDLVAPGDTAFGTTAVMVCSYYDTYGPVPVAYTTVIDYLGVYDLYFDHTTHTRLNGNYILEHSTGEFVNTTFVDGAIRMAYPCNSKQIWDSMAGVVWSRQYLGYYDPGATVPSYPNDPTYPGGLTLNSETYWALKSNTAAGSSTGYVFIDYEPSTGTTGSCNCGNFTYIDYDPSSGSRYSIWSSTADGWNSTQLSYYYSSSMFSATASDTLVNPINLCATACADIYTCTSTTDCDLGAPGGDAGVIAYSPSTFAVPSIFDFSSMPSVGGTAEDLKAQATTIAQNLVNSFVKCYYFSDYQLGGTCSDPLLTLVQRGYANAGEIVSNISKADANLRAKQLADSRTVCISSSTLANGCENTIINDASATAMIDADAIMSIDLSFAKAGCNFAPVIDLQTSLTLKTITTTPITICSPTGASQTIYALTSDVEQNLKLLSKVIP